MMHGPSQKVRCTQGIMLPASLTGTREAPQPLAVLGQGSPEMGLSNSSVAGDGGIGG